MEPISGYITVAEQLYESGAGGNDSWNFGPHITDIRTVQEVSELFCSNWGVNDMLDHDNQAGQPHEAKSLSLDISKAFFGLHWSPKWDLEDSIKHTVNWYKAYLEGNNTLDLTYKQIEEYFIN